jgi:hypothetical protein
MMTRSIGGGTSAKLGEERMTPMSRTAATTVAIGLDRGSTRRPRTRSPCRVTGTTVEATSHAAEAATTAHTKESAGLMPSRCQEWEAGSMPSAEERFRGQRAAINMKCPLCFVPRPLPDCVRERKKAIRFVDAACASTIRPDASDQLPRSSSSRSSAAARSETMLGSTPLLVWCPWTVSCVWSPVSIPYRIIPRA